MSTLPTMVASWSHKTACTRTRRRTRSSRCSPARCTCHPRPVFCPHNTACTPAQGESTRSSRCSPPRCTWYPRPGSCPHRMPCTPAEEACTQCSRHSRSSCTGRPRVASLLHRSPGIVAGLQAVVGRSIRCNRRSHSRCRATPTSRSSSRRRDCTRHPPLQ